MSGDGSRAVKEEVEKAASSTGGSHQTLIILAAKNVIMGRKDVAGYNGVKPLSMGHPSTMLMFRLGRRPLSARDSRILPGHEAPTLLSSRVYRFASSEKSVGPRYAPMGAGSSARAAREGKPIPMQLGASYFLSSLLYCKPEYVVR